MAFAAINERIDHGRVPILLLDCGKDDFLIDQNRTFHRHLESLHVPHEYRKFPEGHDWAYWDRHIHQAIAFRSRNLRLRRPGV
jgi:enterochelin esterase-like enzyme